MLGGPPPLDPEQPWGTADGADGGADGAGAGAGAGGADDNLVLWRERERRQRTVRVLMMFLLMLLLMDGEEGNGGNNNNSNRTGNNGNRPGSAGGGPGGLRKRGSSTGKKANQQDEQQIRPLDPSVFSARLRQDELLHEVVMEHSRYHSLIKKNGGRDAELEVRKWSEQQAEHEKDEFGILGGIMPIGIESGGGVGGNTGGAGGHHHVGVAMVAGESAAVMPRPLPAQPRDPEDDRHVYHYPWNTTGFYRGEWVRAGRPSSTGSADKDKQKQKASPADSSSQQEAASSSAAAREMTTTTTTTAADATAKNGNNKLLDAVALETEMLDVLRQRKEKVGVFVLPEGYEIVTRDDHNLTSVGWETLTVDAAGRTYRPLPPASAKKVGSGTAAAAASDNNNSQRKEQTNSIKNRKKPAVTLTHDSGRAAFQIFSRTIPGLAELSLVDGFVKLYDSSSPGYSTRKDVLLRVRGVLVHSLGRISLVSNVDVRRSAFVVEGPLTDAPATTNSNSNSNTGEQQQQATDHRGDDEEEEDEEDEDESDRRQRRRRLTEALEGVGAETDLEQIRDEALDLFEEEADNAAAGSLFESPDFDDLRQQQHHQYGEQGADDNDESSLAGPTPMATAMARVMNNQVVGETATALSDAVSAFVTTTRRMVESGGGGIGSDDSIPATTTTEAAAAAAAAKGTKPLPPWSNIVMPYPFVRDDDDESIRRVHTPAARRMPPREQLLEANAADCEFEINMDVQEVEWTVGAWRNLLTRRFREAKKLDPSSQTEAPTDPETDGSDKSSASSRSIVAGRPRSLGKVLQDQALVMTIIGTIHSPNCDFHADLNATALRTDWEATTGKAINYSFYMMLVCLTQILVLLRQLLHSQSQSAATRVSLLSIGWQTIIDALLCLVHIYFSLAMQPLFTAFASVAFFKLLIFCVIEMKYMAMIIQARNSSNGGQTTEVLRRQIAMLHLRFYVALFGTFLLVFYIGEQYRIVYAMALYSFWVPQIVLNVYTEARAPLHPYYIYGMSLSRLVAPLYMFCVSDNFLKEVYPDSPTDPLMCELIVLWVGVQAAILIAQGKYGARFMIPSRFLPPKFDYSRPLPASMLPPGVVQDVVPASSSSMDKSVRNNSDNEGHSSDTEPLVPGGGGSSELPHSSPPRRDRHTTAVTTRNRIRGSRANKEQSTMTKESVVSVHDHNGEDDDQSSAATLPVPPHNSHDCSICYDVIDVRNRSGYMLAPCDHLFHRDCLVQWMDVKMECPICRMELPAL